MPRPRGARKQWRCAICGRLLFGNEDCALHPGQLRVEWNSEFRQAYAIQADLIRHGKEPLKLAGAAGIRYDRAARYVRLWEQERAS